MNPVFNVLDIQEYVDDNGLVLPKKNIPGEVPESGNGVLYTCLWIGFLYAYDQVVIPKNEFLNAFWDMMFSVRVHNTYGLIHRAPEKTEDQEGIDDYLGIIFVSAVLGVPAFSALDYIYEYGENHHWIFNNVSPQKFTFKAWFGRYFWFKPLLKIVLYKDNFFDWWLIFFPIAFAGSSGSSSGFINGIIIYVSVLRRKSHFVSELAIKILLKNLKASKFKQLSGLFTDHFGVDHPLTKLVLSKPILNDPRSFFWWRKSTA